MQVIRSLEELQAKILECNNALDHQSDDAMRRLFNEFRMDFSDQLPPDPFSPAFRDFQMELYSKLTGRPYELRNERTIYITPEHIRRPFPYYVQSSTTAGNHLLGIGFMLRTLDLPPGARVLEFGPGWGNSTLSLALLGMQVTAVDIEPNFCELIRSRAAQHDVEIEVVQADFFWAESVTEPYDAVIFFECFHHCDDHLRLMRALRHRGEAGRKSLLRVGTDPAGVSGALGFADGRRGLVGDPQFWLAGTRVRRGLLPGSLGANRLECVQASMRRPALGRRMGSTPGGSRGARCGAGRHDLPSPGTAAIRARADRSWRVGKRNRAEPRARGSVPVDIVASHHATTSLQTAAAAALTYETRER